MATTHRTAVLEQFLRNPLRPDHSLIGIIRYALNRHHQQAKDGSISDLITLSEVFFAVVKRASKLPFEKIFLFIWLRITASFIEKAIHHQIGDMSASTVSLLAQLDIRLRRKTPKTFITYKDVFRLMFCHDHLARMSLFSVQKDKHLEVMHECSTILWHCEDEEIAIRHIITYLPWCDESERIEKLKTLSAFCHRRYEMFITQVYGDKSYLKEEQHVSLAQTLILAFSFLGEYPRARYLAEEIKRITEYL